MSHDWSSPVFITMSTMWTTCAPASKRCPGTGQVGIDGITKEQYRVNLEDNLKELSSRLKNMGYRPQPKRRTYIPKPGSEKGRPLAISGFEDKLVELALKRVWSHL